MNTGYPWPVQAYHVMHIYLSGKSSVVLVHTDPEDRPLFSFDLCRFFLRCSFFIYLGGVSFARNSGDFYNLINLMSFLILLSADLSISMTLMLVRAIVCLCWSVNMLCCCYVHEWKMGHQVTEWNEAVNVIDQAMPVSVLSLNPIILYICRQHFHYLIVTMLKIK